MRLPAVPPRLLVEARSVVRALVRHERLVSALLAGLAVLAGLQALRPPGGPTVAVVAAARDLGPGATLSADDLAVVQLPAALRPPGVLTDPAAAVGQVLAGPAGRREVLTASRLLGRSLLDALAPGSVAVPVRVADAGAVALLHSGDLVDVLVAGDAGGAPRPVASSVPVAAVPVAPDGSRGEGALVVLAARAGAAGELAAASATGHVALAVRGRR